MAYKLINPEYLVSVTGGDKETIVEIYNLFREQVREITLEMKKLHEAKDYQNLGMLAHKAKSSVAILGMENLAAMLKNFELQAKKGEETDKYAYYISTYENDTSEAVGEIENYIRSL